MDRRVIVDCGPPCRPPDRPPHRSFGPEDAVIVVDVIRATTTAITAAAMGRRCIPVTSVEAAWARAVRLEYPLLVGELGGVKPARFDLTNSPAQLARRTDVWRPMILLSSSGTQLMDHVKDAGAVYLACFRNHRSVARYVAKRHARVLVLGAATQREFRAEDQMCCSLMAESLAKDGFTVADRRTAACIARWRGASAEAFLASKSVQYLCATGQHEDLDFILGHMDDLAAVFALRRGEVVPVKEAT